MTATGSRTAQRAPGRTPPFVLVGLVVVLCFLGFSYWSLSSTNTDLASQLETVHLEKRDTEKKHNEVQHALEASKNQVASFAVQLNEYKEKMMGKEAEIQSIQSEMSQRASDIEKQRTLMEQCDEKLSVVQKDLESANAEKSNLQQTLDAERETTAVCGMESCGDPVRSILTVASKLVGSAELLKALQEANLDIGMFMKGIDFPAPKVEQPQKPAEQPQNPAEQPQKPAEQPQKPAEQPQKPAEQPQDSATQPQNPTTQPQNPAEQAKSNQVGQPGAPAQTPGETKSTDTVQPNQAKSDQSKGN